MQGGRERSGSRRRCGRGRRQEELRTRTPPAGLLRKPLGARSSALPPPLDWYYRRLFDFVLRCHEQNEPKVICTQPGRWKMRLNPTEMPPVWSTKPATLQTGPPLYSGVHIHTAPAADGQSPSPQDKGVHHTRCRAAPHSGPGHHSFPWPGDPRKSRGSIQRCCRAGGSAAGAEDAADEAGVTRSAH